MKKNDIVKIIISCLALISIVILTIVKSNPEWANYYTIHFSSVYIKFVGEFTSQIPFSIFEIGFFLVVAGLLYLLVRIFTGIKKKHLTWLSRLLTLITVILCLGNLYYGTASVSYGRTSVPIPQEENNNIDEVTIEDALKYYMNDYNNLGNEFSRDSNGVIISPYTIEELSKLINDEYSKIRETTDYYSDYDPLAKPLLISGLFSEFHLTGITMSLTGEANYNSWISDVEKPFTIAHEFAHTKGVYKEDEANLTALYILVNSNNSYLRYCGYYVGIGSLIDAYQTTYRKSYTSIAPLSSSIGKEWNYIYSFWKEHDALSDFADWWNNLYLKINGQKDGTVSYEDTSTKEDTGNTDDDGNMIYKITNYSPYQKLMYYLYLNK